MELRRDKEYQNLGKTKAENAIIELLLDIRGLLLRDKASRKIYEGITKKMGG